MSSGRRITYLEQLFISVCNPISVNYYVRYSQGDYFGLRYVNKKLQFRWIELDKPLKKQLDKHAHSPLLYFGVMFYVADAHKIQDGTAR